MSEFYLFFFPTYITNLIQMIFRYELRFVAVTWPNLCLWVVVMCPAFCKLTPKNIKNLFFC